MVMSEDDDIIIIYVHFWLKRANQPEICETSVTLII